jgi:hypothetical protein
LRIGAGARLLQRAKTGTLGCAREHHVTLGQAVALVRKRGVVLEAAAGPVPSLAETIAGAPIRGSWWAHPRGQKIFELTRAVRDSHDILVCRLIQPNPPLQRTRQKQAR